MHVNLPSSDKPAQKWVADGIEVSRKTSAQTMLLPLFLRRGLKAGAG